MEDHLSERLPKTVAEPEIDKKTPPPDVFSSTDELPHYKRPEFQEPFHMHSKRYVVFLYFQVLGLFQSLRLPHVYL